jgi:AraC-like DNA-binding protein
VGFDNVPYFFTLFRRQTGLTPAAFRERHRFAP